YMRGPDVSEHRQHRRQALADVVGRGERELAAGGSVSVQSFRRISELLDRFGRFVKVGHGVASLEGVTPEHVRTFMTASGGDGARPGDGPHGRALPLEGRRSRARSGAGLDPWFAADRGSLGSTLRLGSRTAGASDTRARTPRRSGHLAGLWWGRVSGEPSGVVVSGDRRDVAARR